MVEIKVGNELLHGVQQSYEKAIVYREGLRKSIGLERRKAMAQLVKEVKTAKQ